MYFGQVLGCWLLCSSLCGSFIIAERKVFQNRKMGL